MSSHMRDVLKDQVCSPETFLLWVTVSTSNLHLRCSQTVSSKCLWKMKFAYCRRFSFYEDSGLPSDGLEQQCGRCMFFMLLLIFIYLLQPTWHFFFFFLLKFFKLLEITFFFFFYRVTYIVLF